MSLARSIRKLMPLRWQPPARYHYERWRGLAEREMPIVLDAVRPGDHVADIGASHGVYTYAFSRRGARVEAFEPQADCVATLQEFAARVPCVRVHQLGLGAAEGRAALQPAGEGHSPEMRLRTDASAGPAVQGAGTVRVVPLDSLGLEPFHLLKIDVEGGEIDVLQGAVETLRRDRPLIFVEVEQRHHTRPIGEVFAFLQSLDYRVEYLDGGGTVRPLLEFELGRDQDVRAIHDPTRVYVNNFFLSPEGAGARRWFARSPLA